MSFFQGTLPEGIATAVQEAKSVVCFVTDGQTESQSWEEEFLAVEDIVSLLKDQAVTLRLEAGSQEEGHLIQFYPVPKKPTIVIIKNGELKEYIAAGVSKDDFMKRISQALRPAVAVPVQTEATSVPVQTQAQAQAQASVPAPVSAPASALPRTRPTPGAGSTATSSSQVTPSPANETRAQIQSYQSAQKKNEERKKREEEEAKRIRAEKAKAKADAQATGGGSDPKAKQAELLKRRQREAREERQRILKAIEDDKAARRALQAERQAERNATVEAEKAAPASQTLTSKGRPSEHCSIQVRLFDGSTIRNRFSSAQTLKDVRQWVDNTREDGNTNYTFKVLLTPLPSKKLDVTEEAKSLLALGLTPSSTLILLPVQKFAAAYVGADPQGNVFSRFIAFILAIVSGFFGGVAAFFSTLFSNSGPPTAPDPAAAQGQASDQNRSRVSRLNNRSSGADRRDEQQFYNGNSVSATSFKCSSRLCDFVHDE
ncbi:hypothetical protein B0T26DRAFT_277714 [Lasiosphaeria miniovina]|uniref:UBX domain-containing protein 2 n=1 Tax=Lasiosphaeria miniovina TaxID=1954250 RepID=A0AA40AJT0_9PEZI|nr:uncharacterized protein B0T26DRAFT_277714 [Lasiosphaeria miniovina]KAK0717060.1 hypothetical protein B0T26DRAFT_277714 [Lasiosphaeria miniovina]